MTHTILSTFKELFTSKKWLLLSLSFFIGMLIIPVYGQLYFDYTTSTSFTVPAGVPRFKVECWGAGGGGASANNATDVYGAGGGGGAYAKSVLSLSEGSIAVTVGLGGVAGSAGGITSFGSYVIADAGHGATNNSTTLFGAGGLTANSTGTVKFAGGSGAAGTSTGQRNSGGGGGAASQAGNGGNASGALAGTSTAPGGAGGAVRTANGNGNPGNAAGGGGGGAYWRFFGSTYTGGSGALGLVRVTYMYVEVSATAGTLVDYYATLTDAITAINTGVHQGVITVKIYNSITENSTHTLTASGSNGASYTSVTICPAVSGVTFSGSVNGALITLSDADNVIIDGRVNATGSTASMTIANTNTGASASTVQFSNSAQNNILKYCTVSGGAVTTSATGTIFFGTGTNSNNTVSNCTITNNGTRREYGLYSLTGTNTGNTVSDNTFKNCWLTTASSYSIYLGAGASAWTISGNSFFDTGVATLTGTYTYSAIYVNNTGNSYSISNNYIGGTDVNCDSTSMLMGTSSAVSTIFYPIYLNVGTTTSTVQGNIIQNISYKSSNTAPFSAITIYGGAVNVNANTIGDPNGSAALTITAGVTGITSNGINLISTGTLNVTNNILSNIKLAGSTTTFTHSFNGIYKSSGSGTLTITGNTIGNELPSGSITISSTGTGSAQTLYGIYSLGTGTVTISDNTIANLVNSTANTAATTAGTVTGVYSSDGTNSVSGNTIHDLSIANGNTSATTPSVCGLMLTSTVAGKTISRNTLYNLSNSYATAAAVNVTGLYYSGATTGTNVVEKNLMYGFSAISTSGIVRGIQIAVGSTTYSNNILNLSNNQNNIIYGAYDAGSSAASTCNFYHNTIYLGGATSDNANSYALFSATATNTRNYRNNILFNARSSSGTNYAIYYNATGVGNLTTNYNDYRVTGTNGTVGYYPSSNKTLATLQSTLGKDANSIDTDPGLTLAGGSLASDYQTQINLAGVSAGVTEDYGYGTRYSYTMGAWEFLPIKVWSNNTLRASYGNLKSAFDKINDGTWKGDLTIKVAGSTNETDSVVLNESGGVGGASYTRLLVYPEASDITITGNFNYPLISLNGADNVCINGSVFQNNISASLTFLNNSTGTNASVLKFSKSAQNNSVKYCFLKGNPASLTQGVVLFSTSSVVPGNITDTIAYCKISGTGSTTDTRPYNAIYSAGTSGKENSSILIANNEIYDFFNPGNTSNGILASNGILIEGNSTAFTISGNSFYESAAFTPTADVAYNVISINNTSGGSYSITGNYIGGNAPSCVGVWTKTGHNNLFNGIKLNVGSSNRSSIQGNTIKGFNYTNSLNANWYGINVLAGGVDIGTITGNTLGESTGTGSITLTNTTTSGNFYGIYVASTNTIDCQNNTFGSINVGIADTTLSTNFYGIYKAAGGGDITISNNMVGGTTTENSLIASSTATGNIQNVYGIYSASTGLATISGNTVSNLVNATTGGNGLLSFTRGIFTIDGSNTIDNNSVHNISTLNAQSGNYTNASIIGIEQISEQEASTQRIRGNKVFSLRNRTSATIEMYGIFYKGPSTGTHEISRNFVHTFIIISTDAAYLHGISLYTGAYTCSNNVVFLGDTITTGCRIWGIWNNSSSTVKIYHNTVYINGKTTSGESNTFAFRDLSLKPTNRDVRNNIFWNERENTVTLTAHYAFFLNDIGATDSLNFNDYQFYQKFALVKGITYSTQQEWVNASLFDHNSIRTNPLLTNLGGISPSDYQPGVALPGVPIADQTTDYGGAPRSDPPTMGAWEYVSNPVQVWNGITHLQDFKTLKLAFDSINSGALTGNLTIRIKANIKETARAVLYQSGYGGKSSYTRVHIYPCSSDLQILGNLDSALIELNGARGVVFDGRVNGTGASYNLTLQNNRVGANASTILFLNSAEVDSVKLCVIKGLSTNLYGGIVHLSTSNVATGNKNNCINSNKITVVDSNPSVKSRVINAIYSEGTSGKENKDNCIQNNEIFDVWSQGDSSYGIHIGPNSTAFTITGNSIYETTTFTPSAVNTYNGIRINNTSGNGFVLSGNYIGGKAIQCQGNPLLIGTTTSTELVPSGNIPWGNPLLIGTTTPVYTFDVQAIYLNVGTTTATSVQGNFIQNFRLTSPNTAPFSGIYVNAGAVNIGTTTGNTIGATTGIESLYLIGVAATSASYGVYVNSPAAVAITNNTIGSISTNVTGSTAGHSFYGIYKAAVAGNVSVTGNVIGSLSTANSIQAVSTSTTNMQSVYGIYTKGTGNTTVYNNTIANLRDNTTGDSVTSNVEAIYFEGANNSTNNIERNFIYGLSHACVTTNADNRMTGIYLAAGSASIVNNIIWIGNNEKNNFNIYGIYDQSVAGQTNLIYHNTVYLSGAALGTTKSSYAYIKASVAGITNIRNNIFYNARSGGTTGMHYALSLPGNSLANVTIDANDYYCTLGTYHFLNNFNGDRTSLPDWKTATSKDGSALNALPFSLTSPLAINFRPILDLPGLNAGIGYDYGLNPRNATKPTIGAWERVNKWKGSISIDYNTPSNWTFNMVPAVWDNIIFDDAPNRPCTMDQNRYVTDIVNNQATYRMIVNGFSLSIKGNLTFANGAQVDASATGSTLVFNGSSAQSIPLGSLYTNKVYKLTINNPAGVTLNTNLTADNDMTIQSGALFTIPETIGLTVTGSMTNLAGTGGLLLKSSAAGTASLNQSTNGVPATVERYIGGDTCAWHFISSPVSNQVIPGTTWTPSGTYGDSTGYDLYLWDEPRSCWVYNLNNDLISGWKIVNPDTMFVPGRGYLYAVQALNPTKQFVGNLNGGTITRPLTKLATPNYIGFNLLGNPYPSSIDWNSSAGFDRSMLELSGGGYYIWTWSTTANNYGVCNSADGDGVGTNNVTRYIAPMQAFFVQVASAGTFAFYNAARVHNDASLWLKSAQANVAEQNVRLSVSSAVGRDEIKFGFGYAANESGAMKLFSPVLTAPSLYMNRGGVSYTTRLLTDTIRNKYVPVNFKAGEAGTYTLNCTYDASTLGTIFLEDRQNGTILDLSGGESYTFQASVTDAAERFVLHFGAVTPVDADVHPNVWVSAGVLNVYLENMIGDYTMRLFDLQGRLIQYKKMSGSEQCSVSLFGRGIYLVKVESMDKSQSIKVVY